MSTINTLEPLPMPELKPLKPPPLNLQVPKVGSGGLDFDLSGLSDLDLPDISGLFQPMAGSDALSRELGDIRRAEAFGDVVGAGLNVVLPGVGGILGKGLGHLLGAKSRRSFEKVQDNRIGKQMDSINMYEDIARQEQINSAARTGRESMYSSLL